MDAATARVVTLRELLGSATPSVDMVEQALLEGFTQRLGLRFERSRLTAAEHTCADQLHAGQIGCESFIASIDEPARATEVQVGTCQAPGGTITAYVRRDGPGRARVGHVLITGDFFVAPPRLVFDLESRLRGLQAVEAGSAVEAFFAERPPGTASVTGGDFRRAIESALHSEPSDGST